MKKKIVSEFSPFRSLLIPRDYLCSVSDASTTITAASTSPPAPLNFIDTERVQKLNCINDNNNSSNNK